MVKLKINIPRLFETLHLLFWILLLILFMFYINHQVISQVCRGVLTRMGQTLENYHILEHRIKGIMPPQKHEVQLFRLAELMSYF